MNLFESQHPRRNPLKRGVFSARQHSPAEVEIAAHADRDRDGLLDELHDFLDAATHIANAGRDEFFTGAYPGLFLAACMLVVRFDDTVTHRISDEIKNLQPEVPWGRITGMRNRLVHDYRGSSEAVVWTATTEEMPPILDQLIEDVGPYSSGT